MCVWSEEGWAKMSEASRSPSSSAFIPVRVATPETELHAKQAFWFIYRCFLNSRTRLARGSWQTRNGIFGFQEVLSFDAFT